MEIKNYTDGKINTVDEFIESEYFTGRNVGRLMFNNSIISKYKSDETPFTVDKLLKLIKQMEYDEKESLEIRAYFDFYEYIEAKALNYILEYTHIDNIIWKIRTVLNQYLSNEIMYNKLSTLNLDKELANEILSVQELSENFIKEYKEPFLLLYKDMENRLFEADFIKSEIDLLSEKLDVYNVLDFHVDTSLESIDMMNRLNEEYMTLINRTGLIYNETDMDTLIEQLAEMLLIVEHNPTPVKTNDEKRTEERINQYDTIQELYHNKSEIPYILRGGVIES